MKSEQIRQTFEKGDGVLRMAPVFVPRRFSRPGWRLRLHPDDYYAYGTARGAIKERWFSSVIPAMNGPEARPDEGMSYIVTQDGREQRLLFKDAVDCLGDALIGPELMRKYGTWPMYSKFFDYEEPLFHHLHLDFEAAARVGKLGKPEAYYYPPQYNNYAAKFPHTYFGFDPDVTREQVRARLAMFRAGDNRITELSRAYRVELSTGWYTPPGVLHAPGSYLTYEPQWNSDVNSVFENVTAGEVNPYEMLNENCPPERADDLDYLMSLLDWEKNVDPHYRKHWFRPPLVRAETTDYVEKWVAYGNPYIAAKELTILPGKSAVVSDKTAYGCIVVQGHGQLGPFGAAEAGMLRFGQLSEDEFFVGIGAARRGVRLVNASPYEPLVLLKHFPAWLDDIPQA